MHRLFADTKKVLQEKQLDCVLFEVGFDGPSLDLGSLYSILSDTRADASLVRRIAYVDTNAEHLSDRSEFVELAANRMGVNVRAFGSIAEAEKWLGGYDPRPVDRSSGVKAQHGRR